MSIREQNNFVATSSQLPAVLSLYGKFSDDFPIHNG